MVSRARKEARLKRQAQLLQGVGSNRRQLAAERERIRKKCRKKRTRQLYRRHQRDYKIVCRVMGYRPWPPTYESVAGFLTTHCKRGLSANSIPTIVSALKAGSREQAGQQPHLYKGRTDYWLTPIEEAQLSEFRAAARREYGKPPNRRPPLTKALLERLVLITDFRDKGKFRFLVMAWVAHDGLLRHREMANLCIGNVIWENATEACKLKVVESKTKPGKQWEPEEVYLIPYGVVSGYSFLQSMWTQRKLDEKAEDDLVFGTGKQGVSKEAYVKWMRQSLQELGNPVAMNYTGHSCRAGGATDLFEARIPARLIQLAGRWKSSAYLIYIRDHPRKRAHIIAAAFERVVSEQVRCK